MTAKLVKTIPSTVVGPSSESMLQDLFTTDEVANLQSIADKNSVRTELLLSLDSVKQYQNLMFLKWLVETGRIERG